MDKDFNDIAKRVLWAEPDKESLMYTIMFWIIAVEILIIRVSNLVFGFLFKGSASMKHAVDFMVVQMEKYGMPSDRELVEEQWISGFGIGLQHLFGGMLALPVVLGVLDPKVAFAMARHGAICEMGFEIGDIFKIIWTRMFVKDGDKIKPNIIVIFMALHHSLCCTLAPYMHLNYPEEFMYGEALVSIQGAAAVALLIGQFSQTLDVKTPHGIFWMWWTTVANFLVMFVTRGPHFLWLCFRLCKMFYGDGGWKMVGGALVPLVPFSLFNLAAIWGCVDRVKKFWKVYNAKSQEEGDKTSKYKTKHDRLNMAKAKSTSSHSVTFDQRHNKAFRAKSNWAKVRGAVLVGAALKQSQKEHAKNKKDK